MTGITEAEVDRIAALGDPVLRNLRITQAYHDLSAAIAGGIGDQANWCTFATWASKQAGQTIRQEDLTRAVEERLGESSGVGDTLTELLAELRRFSGKLTHARLVSLLAPTAKLDRSSAAVAKGNLKVFAEIGREFARYLAGPGGDERESADRIEIFCGGLRDGDPPQGQAQLRLAFADLYRARFEAGRKARAELVLSANLRIGYHEQARLQPEIFAALNAPVADVAEVRRQVLAAVFEGRGRVSAWLGGLYLGLTSPVDRLWVRLTNHLRRAGRHAVTEALMTLRLPTGTLRLGRDLVREPPAELITIDRPDLRELLERVGAVGTGAGSGAEDWASFDERIRYIAHLFRAYQGEPRLLEPPFAAEQAAAIRQGRPT